MSHQQKACNMGFLDVQFMYYIYCHVEVNNGLNVKKKQIFSKNIILFRLFYQYATFMKLNLGVIICKSYEGVMYII